MFQSIIQRFLFFFFYNFFQVLFFSVGLNDVSPFLNKFSEKKKARSPAEMIEQAKGIVLSALSSSSCAFGTRIGEKKYFCSAAEITVHKFEDFVKPIQELFEKGKEGALVAFLMTKGQFNKNDSAYIYFGDAEIGTVIRSLYFSPTALRVSSNHGKAAMAYVKDIASFIESGTVNTMITFLKEHQVELIDEHWKLVQPKGHLLITDKAVADKVAEDITAILNSMTAERGKKVTDKSSINIKFKFLELKEDKKKKIFS